RGSPGGGRLGRALRGRRRRAFEPRVGLRPRVRSRGVASSRDRPRGGRLAEKTGIGRAGDRRSRSSLGTGDRASLRSCASRSRRGQSLAAVFAATLPIAILEASSAQNDLVLSLWLLVFVHFALRAFSGKAGLAGWLLAGASLGLAVLTKPSALLIAFPFGLVL